MGTMNAGSVIIKLTSFPAHIHSVPLGGLTKLTDIRQMIFSFEYICVYDACSTITKQCCNAEDSFFEE